MFLNLLAVGLAAAATDDQCLTCHKNLSGYLTTAHHFTSRVATRESILGKFDDVLKTAEPELFYRLESRNDGFYQTGVLGTPPDAVSISQRFDLVIGSGRKGQTYLYWGENDQLFQLPVSYWTALGSWVNSPGYGDRTLDFSRPVLPRCLECHASFFEPVNNGAVANRYQRTDYVLGVSCERCHGPGAQHIALNTTPRATPTLQATPDRAQQPIAKPAQQATAKRSQQAIINPAKLPRARQIDLCGLCHAGVGVSKLPPFSFNAGDVLDNYIQFEKPKPDEPLDVHGNQLELLERSKCFQSSNMTCSTCHNVHEPQRDPAYFSDKCLQCHKVQSCGLFPKRGRALAGKCVDCHLPNQDSNVIFSSHDRVRIVPKVRNHWIKIYR